MAASVPRLCGNALAREMNMLPIVSTQYIHEGEPPKFAKWVNINPLFPHRSRWVAHNWKSWDGKPYAVENTYARYRILLRRLAISEMCAFRTTHRARNSEPHERGLNEYIAAADELKFLVEYTAITFHKINSELHNIRSLLWMSPPHIFGLFHDQIEKLAETARDIDQLVEDFTVILSTQASRLDGFQSFKDSCTLCKLTLHRSAILEEKRNAKRGLRRLRKLAQKARPHLYNILDPADRFERVNFFDSANESVENASAEDFDETQALIEEFRRQQIQTQPFALYTQSMFSAYQPSAISFKRIIKTWYPRLLLRADKGMPQKQQARRQVLYDQLRDYFDTLLYELWPSSNEPSSDIYPLLTEHRNIRRYQARHFPKSISEKQIRDSSQLYLKYHFSVSLGTHRQQINRALALAQVAPFDTTSKTVQGRHYRKNPSLRLQDQARARVGNPVYEHSRSGGIRKINAYSKNETRSLSRKTIQSRMEDSGARGGELGSIMTKAPVKIGRKDRGGRKPASKARGGRKNVKIGGEIDWPDDSSRPMSHSPILFKPAPKMAKRKPLDISRLK
ncbi:hypothetical protein CC80DRAFT_596915 [Byssothecium circinans]|uniref:Uncharacterized protein n=1 Tax=Byssothecium circinans TaxID=147558 RepID=A0A6A5TSS8_9PLEO|nr:hypothetical protein CC80DRAFT_596915 [Byssothecium circinans]